MYSLWVINNHSDAYDNAFDADIWNKLLQRIV